MIVVYERVVYAGVLALVAASLRQVVSEVLAQSPGVFHGIRCISGRDSARV